MSDLDKRMDRRAIAKEFGNGNLKKPRLWRITFKDGEILEDWATSHLEVRQGVSDNEIESIEVIA